MLKAKIIVGYALIIGITHGTLAKKMADIDEQIFATNDDFKIHVPHTKSPSKQPNVKDWTFIAYVSADNDLRNFAARNIKQMASIGSSEYINIVAQLDICLSGNKKITRRYFIDRGQVVHVNADDPNSQKMDSGDPNTLVSCCSWAIENYPARNYALVFWNHGTGIIDPTTGRIINASELFTFNPSLNKLELDRSIGFLDFINLTNPTDRGICTDLGTCEDDTTHDIYWDDSPDFIDPANPTDHRGICWDDSTGNYLTNQKLDWALNQICTKKLNGEKFAIIGFDACLMSMLEVANIVKKYSHIMVGSQEVELGTGWNYQRVLTPFSTGTIDKYGFARNIVDAYEKTYSKITNDYTQSALDLAAVTKLEENVNTVAMLLLECLKKQKSNTVKSAIAASRNKILCTHFDEPSYIDLDHFYTNLSNNLKHFDLLNNNEERKIITLLREALEQGKTLIKKVVIANAAGKNLSKAQGISIYFPDVRIHSSYRKTIFAGQYEWITFLNQYLVM